LVVSTVREADDSRVSGFVGFLDFDGASVLAEMVNRLERLFAISEVIRQSGRHPVTAERLADRFEVSRRTIERDLASLRAAGAPLIGTPGRNGGAVSLDAGTGLVVSLSTPQVTALLMAVAVAGVDMPYSNDASTGADSLLRGLGSNTRTDVEDLRGRIRNPLSAPSVSPRVRRTAEEAVRRGVVVNIAYLDAESRFTKRSVEAIGFYRGTDGWFLNGWCELRDAGRIFRLDRITAAHLTRRAVKQRHVDEVLGWVPTEVGPP